MINVIFDMDGTLINSANAICEAVNEIRAEFKFEPLEHKLIIDTINTPGKDWAKILYNIDNFEHCSFKEGFEKYFVKHYKQSVILYEGMRELLEFLKAKNCYLAIATNAPQSSLTQILTKFEITPFFDKILGVGFGILPKPHPMMLHLINDEAPHQNSVFIGDSKKDKEAAKNANMPYFHAKWQGENLQENEFSSVANLQKKLVQKFGLDS